MSKFNKEAMVTGRVHQSTKRKLKKSGYNPRQAIEYFVSISTNKLDALKIEQFFLNKEIEEAKYELLIMEMKLDNIQKEIDKLHIDKISNLRVESYQRIIDKYNSYNSNESFNDFVKGNYIMNEFIIPECDKFPECDISTFYDELIDYYNDVILIQSSMM